MKRKRREKLENVKIDVKFDSDRFDNQIDRYLITVWAKTNKRLAFKVFVWGFDGWTYDLPRPFIHWDDIQT